MRNILLSLMILVSIKAFSGANTTFVACDTKSDIRARTGGVGMIALLYSKNILYDGLGGIYRWDTSFSKRTLPDDSNYIYRAVISGVLVTTGAWAKDSILSESNALHLSDTSTFIATQRWVIAYLVAHPVMGPTGATGSNGPTGPIGVTGAPGVPGLNGSNGATGATGSDGVTGAQGIQGITGQNGINGIDGQVGATGLPGITGATGNQGAQGVTGLSGITGSQGLQGATGQSGITGIQGATGVIGATGQQGVTGSNGIAGATGATGLSGVQGITGNQGNAGLTGSTGQTGASGITGATGVSGPAGSVGAMGQIGATGLTGATGIQGIQGVAGNSGATGIQGTTGPGELSTNYEALVTQTGTSAPTAARKDSNFGSTTFTWARTALGQYTITASSAVFTTNKTTVIMSPPLNGLQNFSWTQTSTTVITFNTTSLSVAVLAVGTDGLMTNTLVKVCVYP